MVILIAASFNWIPVRLFFPYSTIKHISGSKTVTIIQDYKPNILSLIHLQNFIPIIKFSVFKNLLYLSASFFVNIMNKTVTVIGMSEIVVIEDLKNPGNAPCLYRLAVLSIYL